MATYGDFSSLLQLGVGIGIGLSVFRAPVDLRVSHLSKTLEGEISALRGISSDFAKQKRRDMQDLRLDFLSRQSDLEQTQVPFMVFAVAMAAVNLAALVIATLDKDRVVSDAEMWVLLFIAVGGFLGLLLVLEVVARWNLVSIQRKLRKIQSRRAVQH